MINLLALMATCSPLVHPETMYPLIQTESGRNPYAIAIVNGKPLSRQPKSKEEAEAVIDMLDKAGINYSIGLGQINKGNFKKYNVTAKDLLDPCTNLNVSQQILSNCYLRSDASVAKALSCYYSGNFNYGFVRESMGSSYVERVASAYKPQDQMVVPSIAGEISQIPKMVKHKSTKRSAYGKVHVKAKPKLIKSIYAKQTFSSSN